MTHFPYSPNKLFYIYLIKTYYFLKNENQTEIWGLMFKKLILMEIQSNNKNPLERTDIPEATDALSSVLPSTVRVTLGKTWPQHSSN